MQERISIVDQDGIEVLPSMLVETTTDLDRLKISFLPEDIDNMPDSLWEYMRKVYDLSNEVVNFNKNPTFAEIHGESWSLTKCFPTSINFGYLGEISLEIEWRTQYE